MEKSKDKNNIPSKKTKAELQNEIEELKKNILEKDKDIASLKDENRIVLASISHELKTPLTAIIGFTENLLEDLSSSDIHRKNLSTVVKNGYHLSNLLNCILDFSKIGTNQFGINEVEFSLNELIEEISNIINFQNESSDVHFNIKREYPLPTHIKSDPTRLKQVIINLCNNAVKFTKEGEICLTISYRREKHRLRFSVSDTGIGISQNKIKDIFEPFRQANRMIMNSYGGSGLGLYLSSQIAKLLGGSLTVESELNKGSTFTFDIEPGHIEEGQFVWSEYEIKKISGSSNYKSKFKLSGDVLLAEDNIDNQNLASLMITKTGAKLTTVENGLEAIEAIKNDDYDLILLDIHMPKLNGLETAKEIRKFNSSTPIVAITADSTLNDLENFYDSGFDDVIKKPIDKRQLFDILSNTLKHNRLAKGEQPLSEIENALNNDPEYQLLVQSFNDNLAFYGDQIRDAIEKRDLKKLRDNTHKLKGTAGNFGYPEIGKLSSKIEQLIKKNHGEEALSRAEKLCMMCFESIK